MRTRLLAALTALASLAAPLTAVPARAATASPGCDPIDPAACLLPFPNDWFTVPATTPTGRRVNLDPTATPRNLAGKNIDPAAWNAADGFSPGSMLLARVPGLDLAATGAAPVTDIGRSLDRDAPIVLLDLDTGERVPYWAELDANAPEARRALIVRPARNLRDGHHHAVALRDLRDAAGAPIAPGEAFTRVLGGTLPEDDPLAARQRSLRPVLRDLRHHGVAASGLYLAWDFTVASTASTTGRLTHMRDDALATLGGGSPSFTVTSVVDRTPTEDPQIAREITGELRVPNYLTAPGGPPGSTLRLGADGLPTASGEVRAAFVCVVPRSAMDHPARASLYGHGLLGSPNEVRARNVRAMAGEHGFVFCATRWSGMADEDIPYVAGVFADLSRFPAVPDRLQQGMIAFLYLARALAHPGGLSADPAFRAPSGRPVYDRRQGVVFDGNSQGGIAGGALMAVATDVRRGVLGVPGMNYSTLLNRSRDFAPFQAVLDRAYPDKLDQQLILAMLQMLWDRGEADGYAAHMTGDPLPGTPRHDVLMHVAFGDQQVATVAAEVEARTIGARAHTPVVAPGRSPDVRPFWGLRALPWWPYPGSAVVLWDSGAAPPPVTNTPPVTGPDSHEDPRADPAARLQKAVFLKYGLVVDVCGGRACTAAPA
ncbi:hypothetical protein Afil01_37260 [Actinorhabdospora filicis]|uniref:ATP-dependent DNA helicase RecG n=1 Tax=Actinorhabdospora filicis TaxID=1785913 RepID=A0A9W6W9R5_9ACTN|nr:hypothetical protein [Actinorhabdospora filicis]GLZ78919.1 hypothetical protein Afil01_37260 [Actinorhabdospora filicis]